MALKTNYYYLQSNKSIQTQIKRHLFSQKCSIKTNQKDKWFKLYATPSSVIQCLPTYITRTVI
jgi:hypothetical protein